MDSMLLWVQTFMTKSKPKVKRKQKKHSEIWWTVLNPIRFCTIKGDGFNAGLEGIMIAETKKKLMEFYTEKQRIVKVRIQEI